MDQTGNRREESSKHIPLLAAACILLCAWLPGLSPGETQAPSAFNPAAYKLCGVTLIEPPGSQARSFAVIESLQTGQQGVYRIGDTLSGARITQMSRNSITLVLERRKHLLYLETAAPAAGAKAGTAAGAPQLLRKSYAPPGPLAPEPTPEQVLKNIEEEQRTQPR